MKMINLILFSQNMTTSNSPSVMVRGRYPTSFMTGTTIPALWKVLLTTFLFLALMADVLVSRLYFSFFASETSDVWSVFNDFCLDLPLEVFIKSAINLLRQPDNTNYCKSVRLGIGIEALLCMQKVNLQFCITYM